MVRKDIVEGLRQMKRRPAKRVFDTADHPLPAGVRRRDVTSRHQLYEAGDLTIDVLVERRRGPRALLVGQLASRLDPLKPFPAVTVFLTSGDELLGRALSNRDGEFQLEFEPRRRMSLSIPVGEDLVELPVDRRTTKRPEVDPGD